MSAERPVTQLLVEASNGSPSATSELLVLVYDQLHELATAMFRDQSARCTLQPTALVHEAYVRLVHQQIDWSSRAQFFAVAAKAMRSVLVDHARARGRAKRGGDHQRITMTVADERHAEAADRIVELPIDTIGAIDTALDELARLDRRKADLVELRFFGGLTSEQAADVLGISRSTAAEDWRLARAWLHARLESEGW